MSYLLDDEQHDRLYRLLPPCGATHQQATDPRKGATSGADAAAPYLSAARRRVGAGLLIAELARQNDIRLDPTRVSEALMTIASTYEEPDKVVELYSRDPQLMSALQNRVMEDQVVEWMVEHARHSEQSLSFNEVMRPGA